MPTSAAESATSRHHCKIRNARKEARGRTQPGQSTIPREKLNTSDLARFQTRVLLSGAEGRPLPPTSPAARASSASCSASRAIRTHSPACRSVRLARPLQLSHLGVTPDTRNWSRLARICGTPQPRRGDVRDPWPPRFRRFAGPCNPQSRRSCPPISGCTLSLRLEAGRETLGVDLSQTSTPPRVILQGGKFVTISTNHEASTTVQPGSSAIRASLGPASLSSRKLPAKHTMPRSRRSLRLESSASVVDACSALQGDGKLLLAGFSSAARLDADGTLGTSFGDGGVAPIGQNGPSPGWTSAPAGSSSSPTGRSSSAIMISTARVPS